jgi:AcrR family transcriptional regulator
VPPRKGQRQARGLLRRRQILDAALALIAESGYRATSLAAVAEAVGLTEAGVLHHFPSKDALVQEVLAHRDSLEPEARDHVAEPGGGLGSLRRIPALAQVLLDNPALMRFDAVIEGESVAEGGAIRARVRDRHRVIRTGLAALLTEGVRRGELREDVDVETVATEIVAFMGGIQTQWVLDPERVDLVASYQRYVDGLVRQLAREDQPMRA